MERCHVGGVLEKKKTNGAWGKSCRMDEAIQNGYGRGHPEGKTLDIKTFEKSLGIGDSWGDKRAPVRIVNWGRGGGGGAKTKKRVA